MWGLPLNVPWSKCLGLRYIFYIPGLQILPAFSPHLAHAAPLVLNFEYVKWQGILH